MRSLRVAALALSFAFITGEAIDTGSVSEGRARAVVDWLAARGIDRARISAIGRGEAEPIATNQTAEGRQLNRRVEIRRRPS